MQSKKFKTYGWVNIPDAPENKIRERVEHYKQFGIDGFICITEHNLKTYKKIGKIVKDLGLEFHAWIPAFSEHSIFDSRPELFAVNRLGDSTYDKPPYVSRYKFLCPNKEEVFDYLAKFCDEIADYKEIDGIHLDYVRFPDVILPRGLWDKYGLVMNEEKPEFDYCYCEKCTTDFEKLSGIKIKNYENPSLLEEWKQFRYDLITNFVNRLAELVHAKNKVLSAAVFPGPEIAKKIVRQEWNKWNVDALYLMNYNDFYLEGPEWIGKICKEAVAAVNNKKLIYSGLLICTTPEKNISDKNPENHGLLAEELDSAIKNSIENGASGICLFMPRRMRDEHWSILVNIEYV